MFDHDFHFGFPFVSLDEPAPLHLTAVGVETDWDPKIIHDNSGRDIYTYIFLYTLNGSCMVETEDGNIHKIQKNDAAFLFMPSNSRYYTDPKSDELWRYFYIMFIVKKMTKSYCNEIHNFAGYTFSLPPQSASVTSAVDLITRRRNGLINHPKLASAAAYDFLCKLYYDTTVKNPNYSILVQQTIEIMEERYGKLAGIQELADILHLSAEHLTRTFTKETGTSPIKYLTRIRMKNALQMLSHTDKSIAAIASQCGFGTSSYFTRVFKQQMSISPSDYRNRFRK